jgi:RND superfamily putative drug exporter
MDTIPDLPPLGQPRSTAPHRGDRPTGAGSSSARQQAVAHGIKTTAGVVTSAAIVMVGVFPIFAALQAMIFKQFGVGLAAAILIDAIIVRAVLLPASMKLFAERNWYLPGWLDWLPYLEHAGAVDSPTPVKAPPLHAATGSNVG